jgi:hypothetical protein
MISLAELAGVATQYLGGAYSGMSIEQASFRDSFVIQKGEVKLEISCSRLHMIMAGRGKIIDFLVDSFHTVQFLWLIGQIQQALERCRGVK